MACTRRKSASTHSCDRPSDRTWERLVVSTTGTDPSVAFTGSSGYQGDQTQTGLLVPATPTVDQGDRYLFRLCALRVPTDCSAVVRGIRQMLTIGTEVAPAGGGQLFPFELPITDPTWHFVDGNVVWHLRRVGLSKPDQLWFNDVGFPPPDYTTHKDGVGPAILARAYPPNYRALNNAAPYGDDIGGMGMLRDMRFPWSSSEPSYELDIDVQGPCDLVLYASVYQTDPDNRPVTPAVADGPWLRPEDSFVLTWPEARYWRIAGQMIVDMCHGLPRSADPDERLCDHG